MKYAEVIVDNRASLVDRPFTYSINAFEDIAKEGMRVVIPFGRGNKPIKGFIIGIIDKLDEEYEVKNILDVIDTKPLVSKELISLGLWMKDRYLSPYLDALQPILPPGDFKKIQIFIELKDNKESSNIDNEKKIVEYLKINGTSSLENIKEKLQINNINPIIKKLEDDEVIDVIMDIKTVINKKYEKWVKVENLDRDKAHEIIGGRSKKQILIYDFLLGEKEIPIREVLSELSTSLSTLRSMEEKKVISIIDKEVTRNPIKRTIPNYKKHLLNHQQYLVFSNIIESIDNHREENFLIHGITGSGKTEVYLQLVEEMLRLNKDTIILVPEISLTPQTIDRFVGRFGEEVAVLHSKLSQGERFDQWSSIREGRVKIVVGARSAVFAPFSNLGLIIIDEEHENTYKSSQNPKYDTLEVAMKRHELEGATVVMGTATPSMESYYNSQVGRFKLLELKERATKGDLPDVVLVDMRQELVNGNKSIFSFELYNELKKNLENKKQTILFLNRRGFSTFVSCRSCGYVAKCHNCDISMTYHRNIGKLRCHYCGDTANSPEICPSCGSKYIKYFGIGTEKVEEQTRDLFPDARVVRMDSDTTSEKGSFDAILEEMKNGEIDILIGTQMISKGLDFPNVTLVGIIAADTTLNLPDFRSPEKAFQLVTQVAGRSGRGDYPGKVILQTYNPDHYSIVFSKDQDYNSFYNMEIGLRKEFLYPPFINLISILIYGDNISKVKEKSHKLYDIIKLYMMKNHMDIGKLLIGPNPAPIERIKRNYRWNILIKGKDEDMEGLKNLIHRVCILDEAKIKEGVKFSIDINPQSIL